MQWVADVLTATMILVSDLVAASWLSLILLAIVPFIRRRAVPQAKIRPLVAYAVVAMVALIAAALRTVTVGEPRPPWYSDDFANVLSADTFVHGRLSNPPHPLHRYFEALYILQTPRYASVYPPGQGLLLAAAQRISGLRVAGLWLASAFASCAILWAVAAVVPLAIAFLAGLLCAVHPAIMEWSGAYHVGALAAAGGALAIGGALRLPTQQGAKAAAAMGIGIAILANTRPYEGAAVSLIACAFALRAPRRLVVALAVVLAGLAFTAYYNRAVTGDPFLMPYNAYNARYLSAPNFIWQKPLPERTYPTVEMELRYRVFRRYYERSRNPVDFLIGAWRRIREMFWTAIPSSPGNSWLNTLRLYAAIPLLFALRRNAGIVVACLVFIAAILQITWWPQTHYLAPAAALFAIIYSLGVQRMIDNGDGVLAFSCISVAFVIALGVYSTSLALRSRPSQPHLWIVERLGRRTSGQLVIADPRCFGVVFNGADVDAAKIVFAQPIADGIGPLLDYYRDREVWRLSCEGGYRLQALRPALIKGRPDYEQDIYYPYHFPGR